MKRIFIVLLMGLWVLSGCSSSSSDSNHMQSKSEDTSGNNSSSRDSDRDGLTDQEEAAIGTKPDVIDSDGDGLGDAEEVRLGFNPLTVDTNSDGKNDWAEYLNWEIIPCTPYTTYNYRRKGGTILHASVDTYDADYSTVGTPLYVASLKGTHYEMGYQLGYMLGYAIEDNYNIFVNFILSELDAGDKAALLKPILESVVDLITLKMSPYTPSIYFDEARGIADGAKARAKSDSRTIDIDALDIMRMVITANVAELYIPETKVPWGKSYVVRTNPFQCSFFAAWGPRTEGGRLIATRNLDWNADTGVAKYKLLTLYQPDDGIPYVTQGWAGFIGAIAGMNAKGICVSEIGSSNAEQTLQGTPWTLRLREVLRRGDNLANARKVFEEFPNTQGFNFMIADGDPDGWRGAHQDTGGYKPGAWAIETNAKYTAFFGPNDPREDLAVYKGICYALKLENAVFRSDTAMDQDIRSTQAASNGPAENKEDPDPTKSGAHRDRYVAQYERLKAYADQGIKLTPREGVAISKGVAMGCNVLSVVYAPTVGDFYVGYEKGGRATEEDDQWQYAPVSRYERFNIFDLINQK